MRGLLLILIICCALPAAARSTGESFADKISQLCPLATQSKSQLESCREGVEGIQSGQSGQGGQDGQGGQSDVNPYTIVLRVCTHYDESKKWKPIFKCLNRATKLFETSDLTLRAATCKRSYGSAKLETHCLLGEFSWYAQRYEIQRDSLVRAQTQAIQ